MSNDSEDSPLRSSTYISDEADITLLSSNGIEFKVHSYMLKAHSLVLRSVLCDPAFRPSPMNIDVKAVDLTCFLDLMHNKPPHSIANWDQAAKVLDLIDQYECDMASERVWVAINTKAEREPWAAFRMASRRDLLELAKHALNNMASDVGRQKMRMHSLSLEDASDIALSYLLGLVQRLSVSAYTESFGFSSYHNDWKGIAGSFKPVYSKKAK